MEKLMYELKPYFCLILAFGVMQMDFVLLSPMGTLARLAALTLIASAAFILFLRGTARGYFNK